LKVAIAIALTGAIVGELPTGAVAGIGARLLVGSYNGLTLMIWGALVASSVMAALLVWLVGFAERKTLAHMGVKP
jgi:NitT/TauT family transport system permease protein